MLKWIIPDKALTWQHRCVAWRLDACNGMPHFMYNGGLDIGYILHNEKLFIYGKRYL